MSRGQGGGHLLVDPSIQPASRSRCDRRQPLILGGGFFPTLGLTPFLATGLRPPDMERNADVIPVESIERLVPAIRGQSHPSLASAL